ncbi:hypothetical protein KC950_01920 [Candidatus Saccharibacteria bacterium]|nr:hypothetical protein [Candidatus Saccharibacteria bacterium]
MKKLNKLVFAAALLFLAMGAISVINLTNTASAQELIEEDSQPEQTEESQSEEVQEEQPTEDNQDTGNSYNYVAQPGDSYSLMARKAVQTYGINNEVSLNDAQIIFAETNITQAAGSPLLSLGQEVQISEGVVQDWADQAQNLSEEDQAAWAQYAEGANFNTNSVGEVAS